MNIWLLPYASRVGHRFVDGVGHAILPYWTQDDLDNYVRVIEKLSPLPMAESEWLPGHIKLSDDNWYPLDTNRYPDMLEYISPPNLNPSIITWGGVKYDTSEVLSSKIPKVDYRLLNMARAAYGDSVGLVPFDKKYPEASYDDGHKRISVKETEVGIAVSLEPDQYLLELYPSDSDVKLITSFYINLWNDGQLLTNYGHYFYLDHNSTIELEMVVKVDGLLPHDLLQAMDNSLTNINAMDN
jgi:hypothetical protein